jgi:hypothetical protein
MEPAAREAVVRRARADAETRFTVPAMIAGVARVLEGVAR